MKRNQSIDVMRGIVMIIMALDHVRDMLHVTSLTQSPTDLNTTTPALFFTRWITYLCAPTFVFLSGTSAFLSMRSRNDIAASRRFLLTRGLWLLLLEFTVVNFGMWFDIHFSVLIFEVIAAIGISFILLALFIKLSWRTIGIIGATIIVLHALVPLPVLSAPGAFPFGNGKLFLVAYPPLPWLGIMLTGFACGKFFQLPEERQKRLFLKTGLIATGLFILIRAVNIYGDPAPWSVQKNFVYTLLSFVNVSKYPPSLLFCLLFLGIMFLVLSLVQDVKNKWTAVADVYGKVPLFYFLAHWYLVHPLVFIMVYLQGYKSSDMLFGFNFGRPKAESGLPLWAVYLVWSGIVCLMYPLCRWYQRYKSAHPEKKWLRYI